MEGKDTNADENAVEEEKPPQSITLLDRTFEAAVWFSKIILGTAATASAAAIAFATAVGAHDLTAPTPEELLEKWGYDSSRLSEIPTRNTKILDPSNPLSYAKAAWERAEAYYESKFSYETPFEMAYRVFDERNKVGYALAARKDGETHYVSPIFDEEKIRAAAIYTTRSGETYSLFTPEDLEIMKVNILLHEWRHTKNPVSRDGSTSDLSKNETAADLFAVKGTKELSGKDISQTMIRWRLLNSHPYLFKGEADLFSMDTHDSGLMLKYQQMGRAVDAESDISATDAIRIHYVSAFQEKGVKPESLDDIIACVKRMRKDKTWYARSGEKEEYKEAVTLSLDSLIEALQYLKTKGPEAKMQGQPQQEHGPILQAL